MSDSYEINERNEVVPYTAGRMCTDTRAWRDATDLELQQKDIIRTLQSRVVRAEELLSKARNQLDNPNPLSTLDERIDAFLSGASDE